MQWRLCFLPMLSACSGGKGDPPDEVCNGADDDGDGLVDEGFSDLDGDGLADCVDDSCDVPLPGAAAVAVSEACATGRRSADDPWDVKQTWVAQGAGTGAIVTPTVGLFTDPLVPDIAWVEFGTYDLVVERGDGSGAGFALTGFCPFCGLSLGDVDGDGEIELVAMTADYAVVGIGPTGEIEWTSASASVPPSYPESTIADLDGDGTAEIVFDRMVVSGVDGAVRFELESPESGWFTPVVADLDLDGSMEILLGEKVYDAEGEVLWSVPASGWAMFSLVVQADDDDEAEVLFVGDETSALYDHDGFEIWLQAISGTNAGPPCAADFDGDGDIEIGLPESTVIEVIELDGELLWDALISDSSGAAGCSAWDLNEDGAYELLYADQESFIIFDGADGTRRYVDDEHTSNTLWEYPVPVDVDGDGVGEIVVSSNGERHGVYVYEHAEGGWPSATASWPVHDWCGANQYADGAIPVETSACWLSTGTFRAQVLVRGATGGADLTVALTGLCAESCSDPVVAIGYQVANNGVEDVEAGVLVGLYTVVGGERILVETDTLDAIPAGQSLDGRSFRVAPSNFGSEGFVIRVDDDASGRGAVRECDEDNNEVVWTDWVCDAGGGR